MAFVLSMLTLLGLFAVSEAPQRSRAADLRAALDQAVMLHEAAARNRDPDQRFSEPISDKSREIELDLVYMELDAGFLDNTCVCNQGRVFDMRLMIAYARVLEALGLPDAEVIDRIVADAGEQGGQVRQLLGFAGVDGINHFICVDYLRTALGYGMQAHELREYINRLETPKASTAGGRMASAH